MGEEWCEVKWSEVEKVEGISERKACENGNGVCEGNVFVWIEKRSDIEIQSSSLYSMENKR